MTDIIVIHNVHPSHQLKKAVSQGNIPAHLSNTYEAVAESAHATGLEIMKNIKDRSTPVINENDIGFKRSDLSWLSRIEVMMAFAQGIPSDFNDLTKLQKHYLVDWGAPKVLAALGEIESVTSNFYTIKHAQYFFNKSENAFLQGIKDKLEIVSQEREIVTLLRAQQLCKESSSGTAIIVFGASHDFEKTAKCLPSVSVSTRNCFVPFEGMTYDTIRFAPFPDCKTINATARRFGYFDQQTPSVKPATAMPLLCNPTTDWVVLALVVMRIFKMITHCVKKSSPVPPSSCSSSFKKNS